MERRQDNEDLTRQRSDEFMAFKEREVHFLSSFLGPSEVYRRIKTEQDNLKAKQRARRQLLARAAREVRYYTETNSQGYRKYRYFDYEFKFNNQRYDLEFTDRNVAERIYGPIMDIESMCGVFTASGMAAIAAAAMTVQILVPEGVQFILPSGQEFHETQHLFKSYLRNNGPIEVAVVCSSGSINVQHALSNVPNAKIFIVDTTCWDLGGAEVARLVKELKKSDSLVFLVRSHQKLDSFGIEYSRLGSVVAIHSDQRLVTQAYSECKRIVATFGMQMHLTSLIPFLGVGAFAGLSHARTERIRNNTFRAFHAMRGAFDGSSRVTIRAYPHSLFFSIHIKETMNHETLKACAQRCASVLRGYKVPAFYASSFGFDFTALDSFVDARTGEATIRVAVGDHAPSTVVALIAILKAEVRTICAV